MEGDKKVHWLLLRSGTECIIFDIYHVHFAAVEGGSEARADGLRLGTCKTSGNFSGAEGIDCNLSSFSPRRTFSISSLLKVSYSISALVSNSSSFRLSVKIFDARLRASSTRRRTSASISCLVSDDKLL